MKSKRKHPKLPNGYGSIKTLSGKNRKNPYGVYPPTTDYTNDGTPVSQKALCYVNDWMVGFAVLTAYKAGTYTPGMELELSAKMARELPNGELNSLVERITADYGRIRRKETGAGPQKTFAQVYEEFYADKFERKTGRKFSESAKNSALVAFKNASSLHDRVFSELRYKDLQQVVDDCPLKHASLELIVSLFKQMYKYAIKADEIDRNYAEYVRISSEDDEEHGKPYSEHDLKRLWELQDDPVAEMLLIMCYSGHRISEYKVLTVDLKQKCFVGGIKTGAGKNRVVPIHSLIFPLVKRRIKDYGEILPLTPSLFRNRMKGFSLSHGFPEHKPHDCRHTFSALCEHFHVAENDRKRMLGHAFQDVTNRVYGHRTVEELRVEIEKIKKEW